MTDSPFYLRYYIGHRGRYGHEALEFEFRGNGLLRYSNTTRYRNEGPINKQVYVSKAVLEELRRIVLESEIIQENDEKWPLPDREGRQELEIVCGDQHISFATTKLGKLADAKECEDPEGFRGFYFLAQDLKAFVFSLIGLHFRIKPI